MGSPGGGRVLRILSDRDDRRILEFGGFEIFDFRMFLGRKILAKFFGGSLI